MTPTYSKINPQELADMKEKYGPWLDEKEVLYLIKREREQGMREELFSRGSEPRRATVVEYGLDSCGYKSTVKSASAEMPTDPTKPPRVTCEQIASFSHPYRLLALVLCMIALEAWMLARLLH